MSCKQFVTPNEVKGNSSYKFVLSTVTAIEKIIEGTDWNDLKDLIKLIGEHIRTASRGTKERTWVLNICLRTLKIAREEALKAETPNAEFEENKTNRLFATGDNAYENVTRNKLLDPLLSAYEEFVVDIKSCCENISDLSLEFIHADELILTRGYSQAAYQFLRRAGEKKRSFKVIICEGYPENMGHKLAEDLSKEGIFVILIPDSHVFGLMSRINKVIIGCHAVFPDGTIMAPTGTFSVLLAAKRFSIPSYVCLPQYKLSPVPLQTSVTSPPPYEVIPTASPNDSSLDWLDSPDIICPPNDPVFSDGSLKDPPSSLGPVVWAPRWEYIPAGLVSLFLTNLGSHAPSYLYALGRELFHTLDIQNVLSSD
ncbi:unnamed protein product [Calicophoron daubneyi]|uniref:Translation initiation factor eIF2B subunit beta n=1 Tax=Calicophoron daubneyi TaxID=300641 RepID=A0AAV2T1Q6_CALDB